MRLVFRRWFLVAGESFAVNASAKEADASRFHGVAGDQEIEPKTLAGAAVLLRCILTALDAHNCRSPWRGSERVELWLVEAALGVVEAARAIVNSW